MISMINCKFIEYDKASEEKAIKDAYNEYLDLYYNSTKTVSEICKELDITKNSSLHKKILKMFKADDNINGQVRFSLITKNKWIKK